MFSQLTNSECSNSRFENANVVGPMTGRTVHTLIPAKKLAGETLKNTIIPAILARSFANWETAPKVILATSLMVFLNAGFILLVTELSFVTTEPFAGDEFVSLLIPLINSVSQITLHRNHLFHLLPQFLILLQENLDTVSHR